MNNLPNDIFKNILVPYLPLNSVIRLCLCNKKFYRSFNTSLFKILMPKYLTKKNLNLSDYLLEFRRFCMQKDIDMKIVHVAIYGYEVALEEILKSNKIDEYTLLKSFEVAAENGHEDIITQLINDNPDLISSGRNKLHLKIAQHCAETGKLDMLKFFCRKVLLPADKKKINTESGVFSGCIDTVKYIIENLGSESHLKDKSCLQMAVLNGNIEIIGYLCEAKAPVSLSMINNCKDKEIRALLRSYLPEDKDTASGTKMIKKMDANLCQAVTMKDTQCKGKKMKDSNYCARHRNRNK